MNALRPESISSLSSAQVVASARNLNALAPAFLFPSLYTRLPQGPGHTLLEPAGLDSQLHLMHRFWSGRFHSGPSCFQREAPQSPAILLPNGWLLTAPVPSVLG